MKSLLEQFLAEEATQHVRQMIEAAMEEHAGKPSECERRFEFNRFEVTLNFSQGFALIEDVLDASSVGEQRLPLDRLRQSLRTAAN